MRKIFTDITVANICKANLIQNGQYDVSSEMLEGTYRAIGFSQILLEQNKMSAAESGFLWVLNTSIFYVIDYNFSLIKVD